MLFSRVIVISVNRLQSGKLKRNSFWMNKKVLLKRFLFNKNTARSNPS